MLFLKKKLENKNIKRPGQEIEPEEIFWDAFTQKKESAIFQKKIEVPLRARTIKGLWFFFFFLVFLIFARTFQSQVMDYEKLSALAQGNKFVINTLEAQRGVIYDKNFEQLVANRPSFSLILEKNRLPKNPIEKEIILKRVAWILELEKEKLERKINQQETNRFVIADELDYKKLILLESKIKNLNGFSIENVGIRKYKDGSYFSHVIGFYRKGGDNTGLERFYNQFLSPNPGEIKRKRNVFGEIISENIISSPESGNSLVLWLDAELQRKLKQTLTKHIEAAGVERAAAVAIDPRTGGILALVSLPSFDNNLFSQGMTQEQWRELSENKNLPFLNRVISGKYAAGSTIKPLIAAAALEENIVSGQTIIDGKSEIVIENPWFPDKPFIFRDWMTHGRINIKEAIADSSNVFFYIIGGGYRDFVGLGPERIKKYLELFGWSEKLGIDLPGEKKGFLPCREWKNKKFSPPDNIWMPGDTYHFSIGQGFLTVTPLEVAVSFTAIANDGKLLSPRLVRKIVDKDKNIIKELEPVIIRQDFISEKNLDIVQKGMKGTVEHGTATILGRLPVSSAAKTGTAEIPKEGYNHSWLGVFAPYEDPEIVLTLIVEEGFGMHVAVIPTAYDVLSWHFNRPDYSVAQ